MKYFAVFGINNFDHNYYKKYNIKTTVSSVFKIIKIVVIMI